MIATEDPESLFDTRGGSLMAHCCERCRDPIPKDSFSPLCGSCADELNEEVEE